MSLLLGGKGLFPSVIHSYVHISPVKKVSNKARWELGKSALMMTSQQGLFYQDFGSSGLLLSLESLAQIEGAGRPQDVFKLLYMPTLKEE